MKNKSKPVFILVFALVMLVTISGCGGNKPANRPVSNELSETYDIQSTEYAPSEITQESESAEDSTVEDESTEAPREDSLANTMPVEAPVNGTAAEIVKYYNNSVNGVCNKTVMVKRTTEMAGELIDVSGIMASFLEGSSEEMFGETAPETETKSFVNGFSGNTTLGEFMPRGNGTPSELTAAGVTKATCTASSDNYKVVLYIKDESGSGMDWTPIHHNSCMGIPMDSGFGFFGGTPEGAPSGAPTGEEPNADFGDMEGTMSMSYYDGRITAVIDSYGNILSLELYEPIRMEMDMKMAVFSASMTMEMKLTQQYTFSY